MKKIKSTKGMSLDLQELCNKVSESSGATLDETKKIIELFLEVVLQKLKLK